MEEDNSKNADFNITRRDFLQVFAGATAGLVAGSYINKCHWYVLHTSMHTVRQMLFPVLDIVLPRPTTWNATENEYVTSVACTDRELWLALSKYGYEENPIATLKFVIDNGRTVWEDGSMAYRTEKTSHWMNHVYWFPVNSDAISFHIFHHKERNYLDLPDGPAEHQNRADRYYEPRDPDGHLKRALTQSEIQNWRVKELNY